MHRIRFISILISACWVLGLVGCSTEPSTVNERGPLEPADFAAKSAADAPEDQSRSTPVRLADPPKATPNRSEGRSAVSLDPADDLAIEHVSVEPTPSLSEGHGVGRQFMVDAMVGQVNGQPIYASEVLEPIIEQLAALGRSLPRGQFQQRAQQLIEGRLGQMVADSLILGEAESDLSAQEQAGLQNILKNQREELIRFWGRGSVALAEDSLIRQTSRSLTDTLTETRERIVVQRYLRQKLWPKVNVTRRDIERYYNDHFDKYNPPTARTLRLIYVKDSSAAEEVDRLLDQGTPFHDIASQSINQYRPSQGGLMSEKAVGDEVFGQPELNEALLQLQPNHHSPRIQTKDRFWWIYLDSMERSTGRSLSEVQLEIEGLLTRTRFQTLTQNYRRQLFKSGSYNQLDEMGQMLMNIAMSRFAAIQP